MGAEDVRALALALATIGIMALALRSIAALQTLFADELYTYADAGPTSGSSG